MELPIRLKNLTTDEIEQLENKYLNKSIPICRYGNPAIEYVLLVKRVYTSSFVDNKGCIFTGDLTKNNNGCLYSGESLYLMEDDHLCYNKSRPSINALCSAEQINLHDLVQTEEVQIEF